MGNFKILKENIKNILKTLLKGLLIRGFSIFGQYK